MSNTPSVMAHRKAMILLEKGERVSVSAIASEVVAFYSSTLDLEQENQIYVEAEQSAIEAVRSFFVVE